VNSDNPYQFSSAEIEPNLSVDPDLQEMADLFPRLGAAIVDGLFLGIPAGVIVGISAFSAKGSGDDGLMLAMLPAAAWILVGMVIQAFLVASHSATMGKKFVGIKMARMDGSPVSWARWLFLRQGVVGLIGQIPFAGGLFTLVDTLMIFSAERRCIHDLIADTKVVKA